MVKKCATIPKIGHKVIRYRCFSSFSEQLFLLDLSSSPLNIVYNKTDPDDALDFWIDTFVTICDKHAPYKLKRVKSFPKPKWFSKELQEAICLRDFLKSHGQHEESKKLRNGINSHKRAAKKRYFQHLLSDKNNSRSTWTAINQLTNKTPNPKHEVTNNISAEQLNDHFSTIAEQIVTSKPKSNSLDKLQEICLSKNIQSKFDIPLRTVTDFYNALKYLNQSGTRYLGGLDTKILRLAAPLITNTLTYVFNLCIMKSTFPLLSKWPKLFPCTNLETAQTHQTTDQSLLYQSYPNHLKSIQINTTSCT